MLTELSRQFGHKARIRASGLCWQENKLLLVNHRGLTDGDFWAPPGGGVEFGQRMEDTLINEFKEETGLRVKPGVLKFVCEFVRPPLHAIELFFDIEAMEGVLTVGTDPEMEAGKQIIKKVGFLSWAEIESVSEPEKHGIFRYCNGFEDLKKLTGFYRI